METPRRVLRNIHLENVQHISTPIKIPASPFMKNLGYGTGVQVYKLERSPKHGLIRSPWAIKKVTQRSKEQNQAKFFNARIQEEAEILRKLSHPNIVGFRGITKSSDGSDTLALECCSTSLGSILEEQFDENLGPLPANYILKFINDIANALDYLHTDAKILHGDLKSFNVLVKDDFEICKLCDFGVSLPLDENGCIDFNMNPNRRYVGTDLWSAPEVIDEEDIIDSKADIFSFGLIIYETIALVPPHTLDLELNEDCNENEQNDDNSEQIKSLNSACGTRPLLPKCFEMTEDYNQVLEIFYCCTNSLSEDRPTAKAILQSIKINETN